MPLVDRQPPPVRVPGQPCSVGTALAKLDSGEAAALEDMLSDREHWSQDAIFDALAEEGLNVARQSIGRHRRGHCRCAA